DLAFGLEPIMPAVNAADARRQILVTWPLLQRQLVKVDERGCAEPGRYPLQRRPNVRAVAVALSERTQKAKAGIQHANGGHADRGARDAAKRQPAHAMPKPRRGEMPAIPSEPLVAAIARKRHSDVLSRHLAD